MMRLFLCANGCLRLSALIHIFSRLKQLHAATNNTDGSPKKGNNPHPDGYDLRPLFHLRVCNMG